jgi:DeoR/GlpR family transcriptional regulator of sugar metabolism
MAKKQAILDMIADGDITVKEASGLFGVSINTINGWKPKPFIKYKRN